MLFAIQLSIYSCVVIIVQLFASGPQYLTLWNSFTALLTI